ncbi:MAG: hypothetical protein L0287_20880 [Anaerolineae bacterium]|nr:hypothetical protein [Anaerolineae bacterium]MCI0609226.1 hypothetical protein [Anaerolineae bacterium]
MQTLGKFIAAICAFLFIVTGVIALLLFNIERKAFSSATYKQAFENQNLYQRMPAILSNIVTTSVIQNPNLPTFVETLTVADWESTISSVLPPQELKAITDDALDSIFEYVNRRTNSVTVSIVPLKSHLIGPSGAEVVRRILRAQPACTPEQLQEIALGFLSGGDIILCSPPEDVMALLQPVIESQTQFLVVALPDEVTLVSDVLSGTPNDPRLRLNNVRLILLVSPLLPITFLLAILVFAVRDLKGWLNWWGWPFLMTGAGSVLVALLGSPVVGLIVRGFMQRQGAGFIPPILLSTLQETAGSVTREILKPVAIGGLILAVSGLTMVIAALFVVRRNDI